MVLSDLVYVMRNCKLVQGGTPLDLYEKPNSLFVAEFIGNTNALKLRDIDAAGSRVRLESGEVITVAALPDTEPENVLIVRPKHVTFEPNGETVTVLERVVSAATYLGDRISERRGVGKECVRPGGLRWTREH